MKLGGGTLRLCQVRIVAGAMNCCFRARSQAQEQVKPTIVAVVGNDIALLKGRRLYARD